MWRRRVRGLLGIAALWSAAWSLYSLLETTVAVLHIRSLGGPVALMLPLYGQHAARAAVFGLVAGALFAAALALRGRALGSVDALSTRRAAVWGGAAGAVLALPLLVGSLASGALGMVAGAVLLKLAVGMAIGAGTAGGAVALARRAPDALAAPRGVGTLPPAG